MNARRPLLLRTSGVFLFIPLHGADDFIPVQGRGQNPVSGHRPQPRDLQDSSGRFLRSLRSVEMTNGGAFMRVAVLR